MTTRALLVAEKSVLPVLQQVVAGLIKWGIADQAILAVPSRQIGEFAHLKSPIVHLVIEDEIVGTHSFEYISERLGQYRCRTGWYLQQFVKLGFARVAGEDHYIVWDADTVPLEPVKFVRNGRSQVTIAKEFHEPYFEVFEKLLLCKPLLRFSVISQYMRVNTLFAREMLDQIERIHGVHWIDAVLSVLPLKGKSEFSEYETYANYIASVHPQSVEFVHRRWFRHGSDVLRIDRLPSNEEIERVFSGYSYVSFERRVHSGLKRNLIKALLRFGVSS
jgi:hypothetical protein